MTMPRKKRLSPATLAAPASAAPAAGAEITTEDLTPAPLLFYNVVEPLRPDEFSAGGLLLARVTQEAEELNQQVGILRRRGSLSYKTKTPGLDYAEEVNAPQVGDYVFYSKHTGIEMSFVKDKAKPKADPLNRVDFVLLTDTDILAKFTKVQADRLVGWAQ